MKTRTKVVAWLVGRVAGVARRRWRGIAIATVALAWIGGSITALSVVSDSQPVEVPANGGDVTIVGCVQEDSCTIDYRDGEWHIERQVP